MALAVSTGAPLWAVGHANRQGLASLAAFGSVTIDAANEACIMVGKLFWEGGGTKTVDTTGSSSIQWRTAAVTFANAGTTFNVGIAAVDTTTGPPVRAANVADVITNDVAAVFTGGAGVTTNAWQTSVPTIGTKTIVHGDLVAVTFQMTTRAGVDSILVSSYPGLSGLGGQPAVTSFTGAAYADTNRTPNCVIVASDGTRGYLFGSSVASIATTTQTWNNTSGTKEYGNILRLKFPATAYGIVAANNTGGDCDFILYSDPLGTPASQRSLSVDLNTIGSSANTTQIVGMFTSSYDLAANTDYAVIAKPTSATNVSMGYKTYNDANHANSDWLGTDCYAINRNTGAFASQNSNKDKFTIGILLGAFDAGGGASAVQYRPAMNGL